MDAMQIDAAPTAAAAAAATEAGAPPVSPPAAKAISAGEQAANKRRHRRLARLPERLAICVDLAAETGQGWSGPDDATTRLGVVKLLVERILTQKARFDRRHEFALLALHDDGVAVLEGFTTDVQAVTATLSQLAPVASWRGGGGSGSGHDDEQAQGPAEQKGWDVPALFATLQALYAADDDSANKPAAGFVHRAVLFLGRSYALPLAPDPAQRAALRPLLESDRFFLDVLYIYAVKEDSSSRKRMKGGEEASEVEVVDLEADSEEEEEQEGKEEAAAAAAAAGAAAGAAAMAEGKEERGAGASPPPPPPPARPSLQAPAIWKALTAEYGERDPCGRPQGDYFFDIPHGPLGVSRLLLRAQLLLAHPVQRDGQDLVMQKVAPHEQQPQQQEQQQPAPPSAPPAEPSSSQQSQVMVEEEEGTGGGGGIEAPAVEEEEEKEGQGAEAEWEAVAEEEEGMESPPDSPELPTVRAVTLPMSTLSGGEEQDEEEEEG